MILVTGATRSGKSEWAEHLAHRSGKAVTYIATAQVDPTDPDWQARIEQHQARRPAEWLTVTAPANLAGVIRFATAADCLLVDALGTWLANHLDQEEAAWSATAHALLESLAQTQSQVILVAEETGWGVVPAYASGRRFRDRLGLLTRQIAAIAQSAYLVVAGYAIPLNQVGMLVPFSKAPVEPF